MSVAESTQRELVEEAGWVIVGRAGDVPVLEGRSVGVGGRRIAVFHLADGSWAAVDHACPHRRGPLADGIVADGCVTCPLHNHRFSLHTGERQDGDGERVGIYAVRERAGRLELWVADLAELEPVA